jgi:hypothetical protein
MINVPCACVPQAYLPRRASCPAPDSRHAQTPSRRSRPGLSQGRWRRCGGCWSRRCPAMIAGFWPTLQAARAWRWPASCVAQRCSTRPRALPDSRRHHMAAGAAGGASDKGFSSMAPRRSRVKDGRRPLVAPVAMAIGCLAWWWRGNDEPLRRSCFGGVDFTP